MSMTLSLKFEDLPPGFPQPISLDRQFASNLINTLDDSDCRDRFFDEQGGICTARASAARTAIVALGGMTDAIDAALAYAEASNFSVYICCDEVRYLKVQSERFDEVELNLATGNALDLFDVLRLPLSSECGATYAVGRLEAALEENLNEVLDFNPRYARAIRNVCAYARARKGDAAILQVA